MRRALLILVFLIFPSCMLAQITVSPLVSPRKQFFDASGRPLAGGHICTYTVGSSTPQVTFTDYTGATANAVCDPLTDPPHSDGIVLDAGGYASIYVNCTLSPLKIVAYDQNLVLQWSEDGVAYPTCIQPQACPAGEFMVELLPDGKTFKCEAPPSPPGAVCTDLTQVTNLYVSTAGSDSTGDGTSGSPWLTIQHAIDEGIPGIVCGRYIIHLMVAGTYLGQNNLAGRIFAGGGTDYASGDVYWPLSVDPGSPNDNTWPYSWVEVVGDSAHTEDYIVQIAAPDIVSAGQGVFSVAGGNLTLRGLKVRLGGFGVHASYGSLVNLAGVSFENNYTHVLGTERSVIHIDPSGFVDDCNATADCYSVLMTNNDVGGIPFVGTDGIEVSDGAYLTDFNTSGNNADTLSNISFLAGTGGLSLACLEMKSAFAYIRGDLYCEQGGIKELSSKAEIQYYSYDGPGTGTGISLLDSNFTCGVFGGCTINIKDASIGVSFDGTSWIDPKPTFNTVTKEIESVSGFGVQGFQIFAALGGLVHSMTFSATPTFVASEEGSIKKMTLTGDITSSTITGGIVAGQEVTLWICQDGAGGHTVVWPANLLGADTIGATASKCNVQRFFYDGSANWYALSAMVKNQ